MIISNGYISNLTFEAFMRRLFCVFIICFSTFSTFSQSASVIPSQNISSDSAVVFRLFSTKNIYTFIKLNTRNGQMWQVQWSTGNDSFQIPLSLTSRVSVEEERTGRFFLYPTTNIYNFILIDQVDGRVWQVQWSTELRERLVIPIN